jgi:muramidase (phage lysozyme)
MSTITEAQSIANMPWFLDLVAYSEGTSRASESASSALPAANDGYGVIVAGVDGPEDFTDYSDHPFTHRPAKLIRTGPPPLYSTASGRYQVLCRYFEVYKIPLGLPDFSPLSQDSVAIQQIREKKNSDGITAYELIGQGNIGAAIGLCSGIWASLPGNSYGQGGHSLDVLMQQWSVISKEAVA